MMIISSGNSVLAQNWTIIDQSKNYTQVNPKTFLQFSCTDSSNVPVLTVQGKNAKSKQNTNQTQTIIVPESNFGSISLYFGQIYNRTNVQIEDGATLTIQCLSAEVYGPITVNQEGTVKLGVTNGTINFASNISGEGAIETILYNNTAGTFNLNGRYSYQGGATFRGGTINLAGFNNSELCRGGYTPTGEAATTFNIQSNAYGPLTIGSSEIENHYAITVNLYSGRTYQADGIIYVNPDVSNASRDSQLNISGTLETNQGFDVNVNVTGTSRGKVNLQSGGKIKANSSFDLINAGTNINTTPILTINGGTIDTNGNTVTISSFINGSSNSSVVAGSGALTKNGSGTLKFSGKINYKGNVTVNSGTLELADDTNTWLDKGYFNGGSIAVNNATLKTSVSHSLNQTNVTLNNSTLEFDGNVNTYAHSITMKNGSTIKGNDTTGGSFRTGMSSNSKFTTQNVGSETVLNTISANIQMYDSSKTLTFDVANLAPLTVSGSITSVTGETSTYYQQVIKDGAGNLTFTSSENTLNKGLTINNGSVTLEGAGTLGDSCDVTNNGTLILNTTGTLPRSISGTGSVQIQGANTVIDKNYTYEGGTTICADGKLTLQDNGQLGSGNVTIEQDGTLVAENATTISDMSATGKLAVNGTLELPNGAKLSNLTGGSSTALIKSEEDLELYSEENTNTRFEGSITATDKNINKTGAGTLRLDSSTNAGNSFTADNFIIEAGRLDMKGVLHGTLEAESQTILSPGNSIGALTVDDLILETGATLLMEVASSDASKNDQLTVTNSFTNNGGSVVLSLAENSTVGPNEPVNLLVKLPDEVSAETFKEAITSYYFTNLNFDYDSTTGEMKISGKVDPNAVPEPSTWALLILGAAGLYFVRSRNKKK